jgi:hypothetical protein
MNKAYTEDFAGGFAMFNLKVLIHMFCMSPTFV